MTDLMKIIILLLLLVSVASLWKIFTKAGRKGWEAIISPYNFMVLSRVVGKPMWWGLLILIPGFNVVLHCWFLNRLGKAFDQKWYFSLGLVFLPFIFLPILAFSKKEYIGADNITEGPLFALYNKELNGFLSSIIGYIFILIFLLASGLIHWIFPNNKYMYANLLEGSESSLIPFFDISPFIFMILIPAITMRMIAEERRLGTIELLFTRPITDFNIIASKYLAGITLVFIALIPTVIFYISMHFLGDPVGILDDGATITSYIGLLLLGAVFVAIGIFASALTSNQIVAFIIAVFLCFIFYWGFWLLGSFALLGKFDSVLQYISLTYHYDAIMKGVIDTSDLVYFASVIGLFIFAALTVVKTFKS